MTLPHMEMGFPGILFIILGFSPIAMLFFGYRVRAKEQEYISLWQILDRTARISVSELVQSTHFTADELQEGLRVINGTGRAFFIWESHSGDIVNSRFQSAAAVSVDCPNCGAANDTRISVDASSAACEYCGEVFSQDALVPPPQKSEPPVRQPVQAPRQTPVTQAQPSSEFSQAVGSGESVPAKSNLAPVGDCGRNCRPSPFRSRATGAMP